jgi:FAD/FMN-containing dehydrogenase
MATWSNWSGRSTSDRAEVRFVRSVEDLRATVASAAAAGRQVRVAGSGHSHYPLVPTDDVILDVSGLAGVVSVDANALVARVRGGSMIAQLGRPLHDAGVALANQGDIDRQTIAGATATGTHGTVRNLRSLSSAVLGMTVVTASGELVHWSADEHADEQDVMWRAARLGLGAFGVVTELELAVVPAYRLLERSWDEPYAELRPAIERHVDEHRHFEFFWYPRTDRAFAKAIDLTDEPAVYPLAGEGSRRAWNYEVLPNHRPRVHTEMEFAVPFGSSLECLDEILAVLTDDFPDVRMPVEYRTVAADDVWLSPAYERETATISVHRLIEFDDRDFFRACEQVFRRYDGRPHWGKMHELTGADLAAAHPRWTDWWVARDRVDPDGVFLNDVLAGWRP